MKLQKYLVESDERVLRYGPLIWRDLKKDCGPFLKEYKKTGYVGKRWIWRGSSRRISSTPGYKEIKPRSDRHPKDMPIGIHNALDDEFYKEFRWHPRSSGVFTVSLKSTAGAYGAPYLFFPTGKYEYLWSPDIDDLYTRIDSEGLVGFDYEVYFDEFELEHEWREKYGPGSGNGHWEYDGVEVSDGWSDRDEAAFEIIDDIGEENFDRLELEWIPDESFDDYIDRMNQEKMEEHEAEIVNIVKSYTNKDLKGAIGDGHEIMFDCKTYYLVHESYSQFLKDMILKGSFQMKLPFKMNIDLLPGKPTYWAKTKSGNLVHNG